MLSAIASTELLVPRITPAPSDRGQTFAVTNNLVGAKFANEFIFVGRVRDGDRRETSGLGILHGKMSETANADDGEAFARLRLSPAQSGPDGVAGAEKRRGLFVV